MTFLFVASCYCCPCCVIYKRRKSRLQDRSSDSIDWQLGATTPIRYEIAASAVSTSSHIDLRPSNPPPYDDKDAPPKYSAVCGVNDRPTPYNGSYYPRPPNAGHSSCAETAPNVFIKKQYDVIGQQNHVIGKHSHAIGQRNHVVDPVICQNGGHRVFSKPSIEPGRTPAEAGGRPNGYQGSALLNHTPVGVRGGGPSQNHNHPHWRDSEDPETSNYELFHDTNNGPWHKMKT